MKLRSKGFLPQFPDAGLTDEGEEDEETLAGVEDDEDVPESNGVTEGCCETKDPGKTHQTGDLLE